jgi:hypothetical protein
VKGSCYDEPMVDIENSPLMLAFIVVDKTMVNTIYQ